MHKLRLTSGGQRELDRITGKLFEDINEAILSLAQEPRPYGAIKLSGQEGYRIRVRDFRILYRIDDKAKEVIIYRIRHRREAYR